MRKFSESDKSIITWLLDKENASAMLGNYLISKIFDIDKIAIILKDADSSSILSPDDLKQQNLGDNYKSELMSVLSLMKLLEQEGMIYIIDGDISNVYFFCNSVDSTVAITTVKGIYKYDNGEIEVVNDIYYAKDNLGNIKMTGHNCSPSLSKDLRHYLTGEIYTTDKLSDLKKNDYKPEEILRYEYELENAKDSLSTAKKGLKASWIALFIALLSPILSVYVSNRCGISTLNKEQYQGISSKLDTINKYVTHQSNER